MALAVEAPAGGISAQLGEQSHQLVLTNGGIERFEKQHDLGIYAFLKQVLAGDAKSHQCRDAVALGLVGAGMSDKDADRILSGLKPHHNLSLQGVARELVFAAFYDPEQDKKKAELAGSSNKTPAPTSTSAKTK